ncbi:MAG: hypothetical protein RBR77_07615 [Thauera sp.]|jgi:hypothetical protein|nr:hypothetical protein [Thauera sp.]
MELQEAIERARARGYYIKPLPYQDGVYIARQSDVDAAIPLRGAKDVPCVTILRADYERSGASVIDEAISALEAA